MLHAVQIPDPVCQTSDELFATLPAEVRNCRHGLYVFLFDNPGEAPIRDNNPGREKVVVPAHAGSVKPGKFEGDFKARFYSYAKHLHYLHPIENRKVFNFQDCLIGGVVLDLSNVRIAGQLAARVFEEYWIARVRQFVEIESIKAQAKGSKGRIEWIHTTSYVDQQGIRERLVAQMGEAAGRIKLMLSQG